MGQALPEQITQGHGEDADSTTRSTGQPQLTSRSGQLWLITVYYQIGGREVFTGTLH